MMYSTHVHYIYLQRRLFLDTQKPKSVDLSIANNAYFKTRKLIRYVSFFVANNTNNLAL
jgi:hypothetical protein